MNTGRALEGDTIAEMLYPDFRKVNFDDASAVKTVTYHIRDAWKAQPLPLPESGSNPKDAIPHFMQRNQERMAKEEDLVQNEDMTISTPWREGVYAMYNHVFADVMGFLNGVGAGLGHCHHPCHQVQGIDYPVEGVQQVMKWDTHVLLIPAYLGENVKIRLTREKNGGTKELDVFTADTPWDIWWLKKGTEVTFHVEGDYDSAKKGLAAVLALGVLCDEDDLGVEEVGEDEELADEIEEVKNELNEFKEMAAQQQREVEEP